MSDDIQKIKDIENQIEHALWEWEVREELQKSLDAYQEAERELELLNIQRNDPGFQELQRVLSYCLMRQGNILRQLEKPGEALVLGKREIAAARLSGDGITLARALMSNGTNLLVSGEADQGLSLLEESRSLFEQGNSSDHRQGLGWYWILQADLANAGLVERDPSEIIDFSTRALSILEPIENWPGVARAYAARAKAYEQSGEEGKAILDRAAQQNAENKIGPENPPE